MTPSREEVAQRLASLDQLYTLGQSLLRTKGKVISHHQLLARSLPLVCRVSLQLGQRLGFELDGDDALFWTPLLGATHCVGREYSAVFECGAPQNHLSTRAILVGAGQQWGQRWDAVPRGHHGIVQIRFVEGLPPLLATLPLDSSAAAPVFALTDAHALALTLG